MAGSDHRPIDAEVITREQRYTLHGLKHRGITDTKGITVTGATVTFEPGTRTA
jgi:hypothetical protein